MIELFGLHPGSRRLNLYADGELSPESMERVGAHVSRCSRCSAQLRFIRAADLAARKLPVPPLSADLFTRIEDRVWRGEVVVLPTIDRSARRGRFPARLAVAAGVAVLVLGAAALFGPSDWVLAEKPLPAPSGPSAPAAKLPAVRTPQPSEQRDSLRSQSEAEAVVPVPIQATGDSVVLSSRDGGLRLVLQENVIRSEISEARARAIDQTVRGELEALHAVQDPIERSRRGAQIVGTRRARVFYIALALLREARYEDGALVLINRSAPAPAQYSTARSRYGHITVERLEGVDPAEARQFATIVQSRIESAQRSGATPWIDVRGSGP